MQRIFHETCQRRGQNFGLLSFFLSSEIFTPEVVVESKMNRNLARLLNLGTVYYGCHMGLTGLSFLALEGYRPFKHPNINQSTLHRIDQEQKSANMMRVRPEPKHALMGFDIASQAGSFESSYFEALLLSHKIYEFSPKMKEYGSFYYHPDFAKFGYQGLEQNPTMARMLAEHSAHAGYLGG